MAVAEGRPALPSRLLVAFFYLLLLFPHFVRLQRICKVVVVLGVVGDAVFDYWCARLLSSFPHLVVFLMGELMLMLQPLVPVSSLEFPLAVGCHDMFFPCIGDDGLFSGLVFV